MNNFKNLTAEQCADALVAIENPVILIHVRPDGDAVGSAAALWLIFNALGKQAKINCEYDIPERLSFILDHTGAVFDKNAVGTEAVAIDVASRAQLGTLSEKFPSISLMIDHHAKNTPFADCFALTDCSSAGEVLYQVVEVLIKRGEITLNEKLAYALYTSISSDTGRFSYTSATPETYRTAATLMECGIDWADINHRLFFSKSEGQIKAEGFVSSKIITDGNLSYATMTLRERESLGLAEENFETAIDVVRSVLGTEVCFFLREISEGKYKASLRATKQNVAEIAQKFGGGGHILAAGCTISASDIDEAVICLIEKIKEQEK